MITDEVSLYNLALNAVGARSNLSATTERDRGAEVCNLWYPVVRDQVLRAAYWPSCKAFARLALSVEKSGDWTPGQPEPGFQYAYSLPDNMVYPRFMTNYQRFTLGKLNPTKRAIMSNDPEPILVFTSRLTPINQWESSLQMAIVYGLAANIVMPLTGKPQRAQLLSQQANDLIASARAEAANEESYAVETIPDWIRARGYGNPGDDRYYYPYGAFLEVGNVGGTH